MQQVSIQNTAAGGVPVERYGYYRRCQEFRKNGEQCKAPAEKGAHVCHAHANQRAMTVRRERDRRAVLAEAVEQMRRRGKPEFEMADLFTDFKGIQVTIAVTAQALIDCRIDCKTAGRLAVDLQMMSKLLELYHRGHRGTQRTKALTTKDTKEHEDSPVASAMPVEINTGKNWAANQCEKKRIVEIKVAVFKERRGWANGPPAWAKAA